MQRRKISLKLNAKKNMLEVVMDFKISCSLDCLDRTGSEGPEGTCLERLVQDERRGAC